MHIHSITINCWSIEYCSSVFSVSVVIYLRQSVTCLVAQSLMSDIMIHCDGRVRVQACDQADQTHGLKRAWFPATFTPISHHADWHATMQRSAGKPWVLGADLFWHVSQMPDQIGIWRPWALCLTSRGRWICEITWSQDLRNTSC